MKSNQDNRFINMFDYWKGLGALSVGIKWTRSLRVKLETRRIESVFGCGRLFVSKYTVKVTALLILYLIVGKLLVTMMEPALNGMLQ